MVPADGWARDTARRTSTVTADWEMTVNPYSGTSQARKLGLKSGQRLSYHQPPAAWTLQDPPDGLIRVDSPEPADLILAFFTGAARLAQHLETLGRRVHPDGAVWVMWPRRAAGHTSDLTENLIREAALPLGMVDVKVAAVDTNWSGLRLVWRRSAR
jgi:Protein of unknown function (DUF3052)